MQTYWLKVGLTAVAAAATLAGGRMWVAPPALTPVAVLTRPVPALAPITAADVTWRGLADPPPGLLTRSRFRPGWLAARSLPAGTVLTAADVAAAQAVVALRPDEVRWVVSVTPGSGLVTPGERVDVWTAPGGLNGAPSAGGNPASPVPLATGVRVVGVYTAQGQPVAANSGGSGSLAAASTGPTTAVGLVALAVPRPALTALMAVDPAQTAILVVDPGATAFRLALHVRAAPAPATGTPGAPGAPGPVGASPPASTASAAPPS